MDSQAHGVRFFFEVLPMKSSFILYADAYDSIRTLTDVKKGQLLDAIFMYQRGEDMPVLDPVVEMAFSFMRRVFERDADKYAERCEKAKMSAKMRWDANAYERIKRNANHADNDTVPVPDPDSVPETDPKHLASEDRCSSGAADAAPCARAPKRPDCPYQEILALYHELLPQLPTVQNFTANAKATMRARWNESAETQSLTYWRRVFVTVAASDFLMGKVKDFRCPGLLWIIGPKNFAKIVNGAYSNHGPRTGSSLTDGNLRACQDFLESRKVQQ